MRNHCLEVSHQVLDPPGVNSSGLEVSVSLKGGVEPIAVVLEGAATSAVAAVAVAQMPGDQNGKDKSSVVVAVVQ